MSETLSGGIAEQCLASGVRPVFFGRRPDAGQAFPAVTGATRLVSTPVRTRAPIVVRCLVRPS